MCVKVYKYLKKTTWTKKRKVWFTWRLLLSIKITCSIFIYSICLWEFVYHDVIFFLSRCLNCFFCLFVWKVLTIVTKCSVLDVPKILNAPYCAPTRIVCAWQKIKNGHCELNIWPLYLIFKIWYQSTRI